MGAMCNIGELETAVREKIPVVYVVFNDQGLGNERAFQNEHYGGRFLRGRLQQPGLRRARQSVRRARRACHAPGDLEDALTRAFASGKPAIVDVMIDQNTLAPVVFKQ